MHELATVCILDEVVVATPAQRTVFEAQPAQLEQEGGGSAEGEEEGGGGGRGCH